VHTQFGATLDAVHLEEYTSIATVGVDRCVSFWYDHVPIGSCTAGGLFLCLDFSLYRMREFVCQGPSQRPAAATGSVQSHANGSAVLTAT
jgi:hypothetical protein